MGHQRTVGSLRRRISRAPIGRRRSGSQSIHTASANAEEADYDLALAVEMNVDDLLRARVGEPKTVIVPTWRLGRAGDRSQELAL
jgi:hypothetical protein